MKSDNQPILDTIEIHGTTLHADLWYPRIHGSVNAVQVGLVDIRSADSIRISFCYKRDGWVIEQASIFEWAGDDEICDRGWKESAFIPAWGKANS